MPRSHWKGVVSFGLVNIPVSLHNTIEPGSKVSFRQINKKTGDPIKYKRVDVETEKEVPWEQIGKGYQYGKDLVIPIGDDELKRVAGENAHTIAIEEFVDKKNINFLNIEHAYLLVPEKNGEKGYVILREALKESAKVGIAKVIISTREYLAALMPYEDALMLYLLYYDEQIRDFSEFSIPSEDLKKYKIKSKEVNIAKKLMASMTGKWKPEKYKDEYKEAVEKWVKAKSKNLVEYKMPVRSHGKTPTNLINFVDLLKKSLEEKGKKTTSTVHKKITHGKKSSQARQHRATNH